MSVLIKDMEMPKDCSCCFFCFEEEDVMFETACHCVITGNYIDDPQNIYPLVGIPESIDADKMCEDLRAVNPVLEADDRVKN